MVKLLMAFFKAGLVPKVVGPGGGMIAFLPKGVSLTGSVMSSSETADDQSDKTKRASLDGTTTKWHHRRQLLLLQSRLIILKLKLERFWLFCSL